MAAIDLGARRIGVACSDSGRTLASPWGTIERSGDPARDRQAMVEAVRECEAGTVVVGLPLSLSGQVDTALRVTTAGRTHASAKYAVVYSFKGGPQSGEALIEHDAADNGQ